MFSWFTSSAATILNVPLNIDNKKKLAISDAIAARSSLMKTACTEFKRLCPTQQAIYFDEKQQLYNPWMHIFYDALLAITYLPRALKLCNEILNAMTKIAIEATNEKCDAKQRETLNQRLLQYQTNYNDVCWIDLPIHGKRWMSNGLLTISLGKQNIPYIVGMKPFDLAALQLHEIDCASEENASYALHIISEASIDINCNLAVFTKYYQQDIEMLVTQIFLRLTPIFSQLTNLENIAEKAIHAIETNTNTELLNTQFFAAVKELDSLQIYGTRFLGRSDLLLQFGNIYNNDIHIKLPLSDSIYNNLHLMDLRSPENAENALSTIRKMKLQFMESPYHPYRQYGKELQGSDSEEIEHLNRLLY